MLILLFGNAVSDGFDNAPPSISRLSTATSTFLESNEFLHFDLISFVGVVGLVRGYADEGAAAFIGKGSGWLDCKPIWDTKNRDMIASEFNMNLRYR